MWTTPQKLPNIYNPHQFLRGCFGFFSSWFQAIPPDHPQGMASNCDFGTSFPGRAAGPWPSSPWEPATILGETWIYWNQMMIDDCFVFLTQFWDKPWIIQMGHRGVQVVGMCFFHKKLCWNVPSTHTHTHTKKNSTLFGILALAKPWDALRCLEMPWALKKSFGQGTARMHSMPTNKTKDADLLLAMATSSCFECLQLHQRCTHEFFQRRIDGNIFTGT